MMNFSYSILVIIAQWDVTIQQKQTEPKYFRNEYIDSFIYYYSVTYTISLESKLTKADGRGRITNLTDPDSLSYVASEWTFSV